jgi:hypothetical protein
MILEKRTVCLTALCAAFFSGFLILGYKITHENIGYSNPLVYVAFIGGTVAIFALLLAFWALCDRLSERLRLRQAQTNREPTRLDQIMTTRWFWAAVWLIILLSWLPIWLAAWPGFFAYDANTAFGSFTSGAIRPDQPLLHTLIMSLMMQLGEYLTGSINKGIALFIGLSALFVAAILTSLTKFLHRQGSPKVLTLISILYCAGSPLVAMHSLCSTKDVLFSAIMVLFVETLYLIAKKPEMVRQKKWFAIIVISVFMLLSLRSNMMIALLIAIPFLIYACSQNRVILVGAFALGMACSIAFNGPIASLFPMDKSKEQSLLLIASVPTSQLSRVWTMAEMTQDERDSVQQLLGPSSAEYLGQYVDRSADASRDAFRAILLDEPDIPAFLNLYVQEGVRHPSIYFDAFIALTYEAWYPFSTVDGYCGGWNPRHAYDVSETSLFACYVEWPGELNSKIPWLHDLLWNISRFKVLQNNPLTAWLVSVPFFLWLFMLVLCRSIIKRRYDTMVSCVLLAAVILTLLLGPMVVVRYYLFLLYLFPFMLYFLIAPSPKAETERCS